MPEQTVADNAGAGPGGAGWVIGARFTVVLSLLCCAVEPAGPAVSRCCAAVRPLGAPILRLIHPGSLVAVVPTVRPISADEHRAFIREQPWASFLQTPAWATVKSEWRGESLGWYDGERLVGAGLVLYRKLPEAGPLPRLPA